MGVRFLRQRPIGRFIADFVSIEAGVILEVDGSQHYFEEEISRDAGRTEYLHELGFDVVRFNNNDVRTNLNGVLQVIKGKVTPPYPPLQAEGERNPATLQAEGENTKNERSDQ